MNKDCQDPGSGRGGSQDSLAIMKTSPLLPFGNLEHRLLTSPRLDRILVPTDFSALSICAIEAALSLLTGNPNAALTLVHVIEPLPAAEFIEVGMLASTGMDQLREAAEEELARLRLNYGEGVELTTQVIIGNPIWTISALANDQEFDLIAMTSHGRSGFKRMFLGSVAEGMIHRAHCPVLVVKVPKNADGEFEPSAKKLTWKKLLVGYDHRPGAVAALSMAEKISDRNGAAICLLDVISPPDSRLPVSVLHDDWDDAVAIAEAVEKLEAVRLSYSPLSAEWKVMGAAGSPWDALAQKAAEISADMVVVGPHQHTHQPRAFMGSTAQRLVRLAPCSVLAVK